MGALSQCECPAGIFLVDLRGEIRFAGAAGAAGSGGGGVTLAAGITGLLAAWLPGAIEGSGATLAARIGLPDRAPGAAEGAGVTLVAITTGLPAPGPPGTSEGSGDIIAAGTATLSAARSPGGVEGGGAILAARRALGLRAAASRRALERAGVTVVAATGWLLGAAGGTMAAGNVGPARAGGGGGITVVSTATRLFGAGGIDGIGPFRRRARIAGGFSTVGATLTSASAFGLGAVSLRPVFWSGGRGPRSFRLPRARLLSPCEFGGE